MIKTNTSLGFVYYYMNEQFYNSLDPYVYKL